jgi:hypothetical protein
MFGSGVLFAVDPVNPAAITTKKSVLALEHGSLLLSKGVKLEVVGVEGDQLVVRYRNLRGRLPLADTDFALPAQPPPATDSTVATAPAKEAPAAAKPAPAAAAQASAPKPAVPPALNTSGSGPKPASNYGKAVQKAKQNAEAHQSSHVDPTKGIIDDK